MVSLYVCTTGWNLFTGKVLEAEKQCLPHAHATLKPPGAEVRDNLRRLLAVTILH
jgi:hypothetical protein